jgi:8-oxo-dGTP pyrophosphatase MutT (NUDIX family)
MRRMITFDEDHIRFTNRIVGIAFDRDRVLLHRTDDMNFWALPGGRAELLESSPQTLIREMQEEIGVTYKSIGCCGWSRIYSSIWVGRIMNWVCISSCTAGGFAAACSQRFDGHEGKQIVIFEWHPLKHDGCPLSTVSAHWQALPATTTRDQRRSAAERATMNPHPCACASMCLPPCISARVGRYAQELVRVGGSW